MAFKITIDELMETEETGDDKSVIRRYEQTVDALNLRRVIDAINFRPRVYKQRGKKGGEQT